jgi:hypothetical protein
MSNRECGMTVEQPAGRTRPHACGTATCRSNSVPFDATPYRRWCALTAALAQPTI